MELMSLRTVVVITGLCLILIVSASGEDESKNSNQLKNLRRINSSKFPLKSEDRGRKSKRAGECRLGKNVHELGDRWSPDLGEPFGIMYCIQCTCESVQKKRKTVGRVRCRNVKNDCPKIECGNAVSVPGQCCKVCPESRPSSDNQTIDPVDDVETNENNKEFIALLTPRSSSLVKSSTGLGEPMKSGLGAARFLFFHKNLYYSFRHNEELPRPKFIQFLDPEGSVVEEIEVTINSYQNDTGKVCGVWKKMGRNYRKLLKEEKLTAALVTEKFNGDNDRFLAGRIMKQRVVANEIYSSLLEPSSQPGTGGLGMITVSSATGSIYINLIFNGDFKEERNIGISVRVTDTSGVGVEESIILPKINYESNTIEVRTVLELGSLSSLAKGQLLLILYSKTNPEFKQVGFIQPRITCDIFDTVLTSEDSPNLGSGVAWVYPLPDSSWSYNIQLPRGVVPLSSKIETGRRLLETLPIDLGQNYTKETVSGMSTRYMQLLYEGNLYLSINTNRGTLRGKLVYRGFGDSQLSDGPLMLERGKGSSRAEGLIWAGIDDNGCVLNYQINLSSRPQSELMRLEVMETPALHLMGIDVQTYVLSDFEASEFEGEFQDIQKSTFVHMNAGDAIIRIVRVNDSQVLASAPLKNMRVPAGCLPVRRMSADPFIIEPEDDSSSPNVVPSKCYHDGKMREEYSSWAPLNDTCSICNCFKGVVKCDTVICPRTDCLNPILLNGECCRSCLSEKSRGGGERGGCDVKGDRFHPAGTSWHPYLAPDGFMPCTTCTCNADTLSVNCTRESCPPLNCAPEVQYYPRHLSCCKTCPSPSEIEKGVQDDVYVVTKGPSEAEVLKAGGCKYRNELRINGEMWKHRIEPYGIQPCLIWTCRNGAAKLGKTKCPVLSCEKSFQVVEEGECCHKCLAKPPSTLLRTLHNGKKSPRHKTKQTNIY